MALIAVILWCVNLGISIWNAYAVGGAWVESNHAGGFSRLVAWAGAVMSAFGFTSEGQPEPLARPAAPGAVESAEPRGRDKRTACCRPEARRYRSAVRYAGWAAWVATS